MFKLLIGVVVLVGIIGAAVFALGVANFHQFEEVRHEVAPLQPQPQRIAPPPENPGEAKEAAPDFEMLDRDGQPVRLSDMIGAPIILNFWASWCPSCRQEGPYFDEVYAEFGEQVQFVMLNLTDGGRETKESALAYIQGQGYGFPVFFDTAMTGATAWGVQFIPMTVLIDENGYIVHRHQGSMNRQALHQVIEMVTGG